jgi:hypothetical protein
MANAFFIRLFGLAFSVLGVIFLAVALTNNMNTKPS